MLRGTNIKTVLDDLEIPGMKKENDPTLPEDQRTGAGYQRYFREMVERHNAEQDNKPEEVSQTEEERTFLRLFRKIRLLSIGVMETDYKIWPVVANSNEAGTMWGQPSWRLRLMRAFMSGASIGAEELQEEMRRRQAEANRKNGMAY